MPKTDESDANQEIDDAQKIQSVVETANAEDEEDTGADDDNQSDDESDEEDSSNKDDASDEDDSEEDSSDDDDDDEEDKSKKPESAERKFKNLAADDDAGYISNLEKAYENSSAEAIRLSNEVGQTNRRIDSLLAAVQKDPELAERLNKAMGNVDISASSGNDTGNGNGEAQSASNDPFLIDARTKWEKESKEQVQEILDANPELISDPEKNANVKHWMEVFSAEEMRKNKRLLSGGEAMEAAMKHLGIEDKRTKPTVNSKVKDLAAPTRPKGSKKKSSKSAPLSDAAYSFADKMGVSKESIEKFATK
jgi:hypothetical protein